MFKIGADPELFVMHGDKFISAETKEGPIIPGTKKDPFEVKGGAIQIDGVATEFNINPADNCEEFFGNIKTVVTDLNTRIKKINPEYNLKPVPTATFSKKYFDDLPDHTRELGCEPDFSAYTSKANPRPATSEPFRTGSGHIHIGWMTNADPFDEGHMLDCCLVTKELDKHLHYASLDWDNDKKRQQLYGKPGSFRPKKYGMEYRPLSNSWLSSKQSIRNVYLITMGVIRSIDSGSHNFNYVFTKQDLSNRPNTERVLNRLNGYIYDL